jgi:hypothetical protein
MTVQFCEATVVGGIKLGFTGKPEVLKSVGRNEKEATLNDAPMAPH